MSKNKPSKWKYKLLTVTLFCVIAGYIYLVITWTPVDSKSQKASEEIILQAAAVQLGINIDELTKDDFAQITELTIGSNSYPPTITELSDLKCLGKFPNLRNLTLQAVKFPEKDVPKWMSLMAKLPGIDFSDRFTIELTPLEHLIHLKSLSILNIPVKNLKPLESLKNLRNLELYSILATELEAINGLTNLQSLKIGFNQISNIEALRGLVNLHELYIESTPISNLEPINELSNLRLIHLFNTPIAELEPVKDLKNLQSLYCSNTKVMNIEPIRELSNLKRLEFQSVDISDINPIKKLKNLEIFTIYRCQYITNEQIDDLQNALPSLQINR